MDEDQPTIGSRPTPRLSTQESRQDWLTPYRKLNDSPSKVEDPAVLKLYLTEPKVKKITLHFPLGLEVVARNLKGVTIKDALDAIHKQFKKRVRVPSLFFFSPSSRLLWYPSLPGQKQRHSYAYSRHSSKS